MLHGTYKTYYLGGNIYREAYFENGMVNGNWFKECDEFGNCKGVIHDNLTLPSNPLGWDRTLGKEYTDRIDEELGLLCELRSEEAHNNLIYLPINQNGDFSIEISFYMAELEEHTWPGLIWGMKDWYNFQIFGVSRPSNTTSVRYSMV